MATDIIKNTKRSSLADICKSIEIGKRKCTGESARISYSFLIKHLEGVNRMCPGITCNDVIEELHTQAKQAVI